MIEHTLQLMIRKERNLNSAMPPAAKSDRTLAWLGAPPLLPGENAAQYHDLVARLSAEINPAGPIEEIFVRDLADLTWDVLRLRQMKMYLVAANRHKGVERILSIAMHWHDRERLLKNWCVRDPQAIKSVNTYLASTGLTMDAAMAETLSVKLDDIERIERLIMAAEARRNATLREMERHRSALAAKSERAVRNIEDAQFRVVEPRRVESAKS
jgi:hypothetical protein